MLSKNLVTGELHENGLWGKAGLQGMLEVFLKRRCPQWHVAGQLPQASDKHKSQKPAQGFPPERTRDTSGKRADAEQEIPQGLIKLICRATSPKAAAAFPAGAFWSFLKPTMSIPGWTAPPSGMSQAAPKEAWTCSRYLLKHKGRLDSACGQSSRPGRDLHHPSCLDTRTLWVLRPLRPRGHFPQPHPAIGLPLPFHPRLRHT